MALTKRTIGSFIEQISIKNKDGKYSEVLGVAIEKEFMPSVANLIGTDLKKYFIVSENEFAFNPMHVGRDKRLPIALYKSSIPALVSPAYFCFKVTDSKIDNEYLMLLFKSNQFDHLSWFRTDSSVRGGLTWDDFCNLEVNIPDIEEQKRIVREYQVIEKRIIALNKQNIILERLINTEYRNLFSEKEQAIESTDILGNITSTIDNRGKTPPNTEQVTEFPLLEIAALKTDGRVISYENCEKYVSEKTYQTWFRSGHPQKYDILFSTVGSIAKFKIFLREKGCIAQNIVAFRCNKQELGLYLYEQLNEKIEEILSYEIGSVQASIKVSQIINLPIDIPKKEVLDQFNKLAVPLTNLISSNATEIELNRKTLKMILQKLS